MTDTDRAIMKKDHRQGGKLIKAGTPFVPTPQEKAAFKDVLLPAGPRIYAGVDIPKEEEVEAEVAPAGKPAFNVTGATIDQVLEAVDDGVISAGEALALERAGSRPRSSLIEALEALAE